MFSAATCSPPTPHYSDSLFKGSTLRRDVCCASGPAWHPLPTLAQHLGGISFLPRTVAALLFRRPPPHPTPPPPLSLCPQIPGSTRSLFIYSFMCPCCRSPSLWLHHSGSRNHTHVQILSISTNVAHLSKGRKRGEVMRKEGRREGRAMKKGT